MAKQVAIIGTSFEYIKNDLLKANDNNMHLTKEQMSNYEEGIVKTQKTLCMLEKELKQMGALSKKVNISIIVNVYYIYT